MICPGITPITCKHEDDVIVVVEFAGIANSFLTFG